MIYYCILKLIGYGRSLINIGFHSIKIKHHIVPTGCPKMDVMAGKLGFEISIYEKSLIFYNQVQNLGPLSIKYPFHGFSY